MRDAYDQFVAADIALYAISYDDQQALSEFSDKQNIPYHLLSDVDSEVIRRYGILNDQVDKADAFLYGIPYPGVYVTDEDGVVVAKFFHDSYKKRDSAENLIDAALGKITLEEEAPSASASDDTVALSVHVRGGKGTVRQGIMRKLVVRFELGDDMHVYGQPVPEGMIPTTVSVTGPDGLVIGEPEYPGTETLHLESMNMALPVWSGTVDITVPFYAVGELVSETRPLDRDSIELAVAVRYQACSDDVCFPPRTETMHLSLDLDVVDVPALGVHQGHGQREAAYDSTPHMKRLLLRKLRQNPWGLPKFLFKSLWLELAARWRRIKHSRG